MVQAIFSPKPFSELRIRKSTMKIHVTRYPTPAQIKDPDRAYDLEWSAFYDQLESFAERVPLCTLENCLSGECKFKFGDGFSFARLSKMHRDDDNVLDVSAIAFDVDGFTKEESTAKLVEMESALKGIEFITYMTHSGRVDYPKLRLMIPFSRPVTSEEYRALWPLLREKYKVPCPPGKSKAPSHMFFLPNVPQGVDPLLHRQEGAPIDVDEFLKTVIVKNIWKLTEQNVQYSSRTLRTLEANDLAKLRETLEKGNWKSEWKQAIIKGEPIGPAGKDAERHHSILHALNDVARLTLDFSEDLILEFLLQGSFRHRDHYGTDPVEEFENMFPEQREFWLDKNQEEIDKRLVANEIRGRFLQERKAKELSSEERAKFELTEVGDKWRFIAMYGHNFKHDRLTGWYSWDGRRYAQADASKEVSRCIEDMHKSILKDAFEATTLERQKELAMYALRCQTAMKRRHVKDLLEQEPDISMLSDQLDANRWLFNAANGTIDLRTGEFRDHNRSDLMTKISEVVYDPGAQCPHWEAFLAQIHPNDPEIVQYLQRFIGYSLTGLVTEQCFLFFHGSGSNGKSTMCDVLLRLFGEYGKVADPSLLVKKQMQSTHSEAVAALRGARLVFCTETEKGQRMDEQRLKHITGENTITARGAYEKEVTFVNTSKVILSSNHELDIRGTDHAVWRRVRKVPFTVQIDEAHIDPDFAEKLCKELSGILNWALEGCRQWREDPLRLGQAQTIYKATVAYREASDIVAAFVDEKFERDEAGSLSGSQIQNTYKSWAEEVGEFKFNARLLAQELQRLGFTRRRTEQGIKWFGLKRRNERVN